MENNMQSTDGRELQRGGYYYTRAGQSVVLHDWAIGQNDKPIFLITRFYEGETMEARMYPSGHTEISMDYEHEGEVEPVHELFKEVPTFVVDESYKQKSNEVLLLCQSVGKLESVIKETVIKSRNLSRVEQKLSNMVSNKENTLSDLKP